MKVCIDAGHGGKDSGAVGSKTHEKWIALDVASRVAQKLQNSGIDVVMTRDSDYFVELAERAKIANNAGADMFISVHCNSAVESARGTEVWCYPGAAEDGRLAKSIHDRLVERTGLKDRGVKEENYAVLRLSRCPAALVELGFISNPQEEQTMMGFDYQDAASTAIVEGIKEFAGIKEVQPVKEQKLSYDNTVDNMLQDGIITTENMANWEKFLNGRETPKPEYVRTVLDRYHEKVK
ncbi:MAG: N-acetylmuramoyl-L-alanine amidase [Clostridia bacterium]|nr:N-acetylmuramoyl-L-alanine amidase [Clostridia bacterium]